MAGISAGLAIDDLRREVMLVDQSPYLFNVSIRENIAFALPWRPPSRSSERRRSAGLDELIRAPP